MWMVCVGCRGVDALFGLFRKDGEWEPNIYGGRENLDTISFLKDFNEAVYSTFEGVQTIAEESTSFPMVSKPTFNGGLGFGING
jgi:1,4-alpha-glucan branching enzyme